MLLMKSYEYLGRFGSGYQLIKRLANMSFSKAMAYFGARYVVCTRGSARAGSLRRYVRELRDRRLLHCGMEDTRRGASLSVKPLRYVQKFLPCLRTRTGAVYGNMRSSFFLATTRRGVIVGLVRH